MRTRALHLTRTIGRTAVSAALLYRELVLSALTLLQRRRGTP